MLFMLDVTSRGAVPQFRILMPYLTPRRRAILALLCVAVFFGASTAASKAALDHIAPLTLAFARFAIALAVLLALCRRAGVRPSFGRMEIALGATGIALPVICQNLGLQFSTAVDSIIIIEGGIPIFAVLLGAAILGERLAGRRLAALFLTVSGVAVIVLSGATGLGNVGRPQSVLPLGAAASFAYYLVIGRRSFGDGGLLARLTGVIGAGVLLLAPGAAIEVALTGPGTMTVSDGLLLLYLGIGCSAGMHLLWARGMADLDAGEVAIFGTLMPVAGVAAAALFLGESISLVQLGGGLIVGAGVSLNARQAGPGALPQPRRRQWLRPRPATIAAPFAFPHAGSVIATAERRYQPAASCTST